MLKEVSELVQVISLGTFYSFAFKVLITDMSFGGARQATTRKLIPSMKATETKAKTFLTQFGPFQ